MGFIIINHRENPATTIIKTEINSERTTTNKTKHKFAISPFLQPNVRL